MRAAVLQGGLSVQLAWQDCPPQGQGGAETPTKRGFPPGQQLLKHSWISKPHRHNAPHLMLCFCDILKQTYSFIHSYLVNIFFWQFGGLNS